MIVLGIDPGIERCGYALFNRKGSDVKSFIYITSGLITTKKTDHVEIRMRVLSEKIEELLKKHAPEILIMEQLFFSKNVKTAIVVAQAQGVILEEAGKHNVPVTFLTPPQIKQIITGYGTSDKKSVQKMLHLTFGLEKELKQDDVADAIACATAFCYIHSSLT